MEPFELIVAAASVSAKESGGEDRVRTVGRSGGARGVVVCDGVGSIAGSAEMAEEASELGAGLIAGQEVGRTIWNLDRRLGGRLSADRLGATTMAAVCAEANGVVGHLLVGNGSVVEMAPMEMAPGQVRLLWTSIVLPQMGNRDGRPALRSFLPPENGRVEAEKGIRKVPKDNARLYLACSDGLLSEEERLEGSAPDGTVWQQVPKLTARLLERLGSIWPELLVADPEPAAALLGDAIEDVIGRRGPEEPLEDDTTVGALYLRPAAAAGGEVAKP